MILGVPTSTANTAIFLELNLSLITTLVQIKILKFLVRLKDDEINKELLEKLLQIDCPWSRFCNSLLRKDDLSAYTLNDNTIPITDIQLQFKENQINLSKQMYSLEFLNKIRTYKFIDKLDCIKVKSWRHSLSRLRWCNFGLRIRNGAWTNEPREERTCRFCESNALEDEIHILCHCHFFQDLRSKLFQELQIISSINFESLNNLEKLKVIMQNEESLPTFAKFSNEIWKIVKIMNSTIC